MRHYWMILVLVLVAPVVVSILLILDQPINVSRNSKDIGGSLDNDIDVTSITDFGGTSPSCAVNAGSTRADITANSN